MLSDMSIAYNLLQYIKIYVKNTSIELKLI